MIVPAAHTTIKPIDAMTICLVLPVMIQLLTIQRSEAVPHATSVTTAFLFAKPSVCLSAIIDVVPIGFLPVDQKNCARRPGQRGERVNSHRDCPSAIT